MITNVGRLTWWKGQDYFVQAIADLVHNSTVRNGTRRSFGRRSVGGETSSDTANQPTIKAVLIGAPDADPGSQAFYARLRRMVSDMGLSDHVLFAGFRSDVPDILAASDMVVHSSSEPEPFGRVVVEAMLAERPVIATDAGGPSDILEHEKTGLLVPLKDAPAMAQALAQLIENPLAAARMGQRARASAQERFSLKQHIAAIHGLYQEVLDTWDRLPRSDRPRRGRAGRPDRAAPARRAT
jgi:glycosyltransferase involved in cell wall biosynthesis